MKSLALAGLIATGAVWAPSARAAAPDGSGSNPAASDRGDSKQSWEDYRIQARKDLDVIGDKISKLELNAKAAGVEARSRLEAQVKSLHAKKADADRMLDKFESATDAARKELRIKLDRSLRELKKAVHKAEVNPRERT
ncbi:MAG: hypothetical protein ACHQ2Z_11845 [Elusimicrobiota bacterium]